MIHGKDYDINELIQLRHNLLNKKRKSEDCKGRHSKYAENNIKRKIKNNILKYDLEFINKKIKQIYNEKIGNCIFKKQLEKKQIIQILLKEWELKKVDALFSFKKGKIKKTKIKD